MQQQDCLAAYYLMETHNRPHRNQRMRVVFLVQEPSIWDKQSDVYDVFDKDPEVDVMMVVMPSYDAIDTMAGNKQGRYDPKIWHYFSSRYHHVYAFTNIQSLRVLRPDYVFFDRPYEGLRPMEGLRAADVAQFSKICYISYGTQGLKLFIHMEMGNPSFFSYVSYYFCDSDEENTLLSSAYPFAGQGGVQHFEALGYPGFQSYLSARVERNPVRRILWTPRWSLDENIGGSHFFDYKDAFIE
ncbi:MAG: CDP-glycerol--poly(glycerophosphate) glycerophosphotransferase, partial [Selenomonas artemidis]